MNNDFTYIAVVLDRSGSMGSVKQETIDGFNEFLNKQKLEPGDAKVYLAQFDDRYDLVYDRDVKEAPALNDNTYIPRGLTALYDAIGKTVDDLGGKLAKMKEAERPGKVMVAVITDGFENNSHTYDSQRVASMIKEQQEKYNWNFVFIGANQDAILSAAKIGIAQQSAITYTSNNVQDVMGQTLGAYTHAVRSANAATPTSDWAKFSDEERTAAVAP